MTRKELIDLTDALLIGDVSLPKDKNKMNMLIRYGLERISNKSDSLKLLTAKNSSDRIVRGGPGNLYIRMPNTPENDEDQLDIDEELCFALSRYICSFVSSQKGKIHLMEADRILKDYNAKVSSYLEEMEQTHKLDKNKTTNRYPSYPQDMNK